jgi:hypothetical protein
LFGRILTRSGTALRAVLERSDLWNWHLRVERDLRAEFREFRYIRISLYASSIHDWDYNSPGPNTPPIVNFTNPPNNRVFAAPATFTLQAPASDPGGAVASLQFFSGATLLGQRSSIPFDLSLTNLSAGSYHFTAIATDNLGARATSDPVNVSVVSPGLLQFDEPKFSNGNIVLTYSTTPLLTYVLQSAGNLPPVSQSVSTNQAAGSSLNYSTNAGGATRFYRAFILPWKSWRFGRDDAALPGRVS